jgi:hypothetical protein
MHHVILRAEWRVAELMPLPALSAEALMILDCGFVFEGACNFRE